MFKNVASQKLIVYAYDATTGAPKTGDAANLTAYVSKDFGSVTVLGDTSATEMDATNAKGSYLFDLTQGETNADCAHFTGKSSTANIYIVPQTIYTDPPSYTSFVTPANLTAAQIATGVWQDTTAGDFTTALSVGKSVMNGVALGTGLTINAYTGNTAQTGDNFARLGAPAGASVSADIAAVKVDTAAIKTKTDSLTFTSAGKVDANTLATNGDATAAANVAKLQRAIGTGTVTTGASTTSVPTSAFTPTGIVADQFKGRIITFCADTTTTALRGQSTDITASSAAAAPTFTVTALTSTPASGDTFIVT